MMSDIDHHEGKKQEFPDALKAQALPNGIDTLDFFYFSVVVHICSPGKGFIPILPPVIEEES